MHTVNKATSVVSLFNFYIIEFTHVFFLCRLYNNHGINGWLQLEL